VHAPERAAGARVAAGAATLDVMEILSIGLSGRSAESFFGAIRDAEVKRVLDVRLHNTSNLAGYAKATHLPYFLRELCGAEYEHEPLLAPSPQLFDGLKKSRTLSWEDYEGGIRDLMATRRIEERLDPGAFAVRTALLCACADAEHCHRRIVLEHLEAAWGALEIMHL
jgi:uncharacterized protein (DUF488 family)